MNQITHPNRQNYIDVCKAIGIILVILGHTYFIPDFIYSSIYSFHMPMFFILTGLLYNREKNNAIGFAQYTLKKIKQLLIPYFIFAFVNLGIEILWNTLFNGTTPNAEYFVTKIKGIFLCYSNLDNMPNCSPLWFLLCLFIADLIFWWVMKLSFKLSWIPILCCLIVNYIALPNDNGITAYPFKFPTFLVALFFLYIGFCLRCVQQRNFRFLNNRLFMIFASVFVMTVGFVAVILTGNNIGMNENAYDNYLIFLLTSVFISVALILFLKQLTFLGNKFLLWLGKNTIYIIGFNYVCRDIATELYYYIPILRKYPMHWSVNFLLTFVLCCLCIVICSKIKIIFKKVFLRKIYTK